MPPRVLLLPLPQYGYNQVFEQLFQAYEQRLTPRGERQYADQGWVQLAAADQHQQEQQQQQQQRGAARGLRGRGAGEPYSCPADRHLDLSFHLTASEFSLHNVWANLPQFLFYSFGVSFLGIALAIGIFRPRKQMPTDMFQVGV